MPPWDGSVPLTKLRSLRRRYKQGLICPLPLNLRRLPVAALLAMLSHPGPASGEAIKSTLDPAQARPVAALLDSMGVNTHFSFADTPYEARYPEVRRKLMALGLHHVRDLLTDRAADLAQLGITTTILAEPNTMSPQAAQARVKALNAHGPVIDAVEGANEPDMFWPRLHITYEGQGYPDGPVNYQRDLFRAFKADPATAALPIIGLSLGLAGMANATPSLHGLRPFVDWGDVHPYPYNGNPFGPNLRYGGLGSFFHDGTFPSVYIDPSPDALRAYRDIYGPGPMAVTETGYPTGPHFTREALQARYLVRLYAEYFRLGFQRTYVYQLLDSVEDPTGRDPDASFGLLRHDLSERPSFGAVQEFAHLLSRPAGPGPAAPSNLTLSLRVAGVPGFPDARRVHHLLLSRPDGTLLLLLWHEVSGEDASTDPRRAIAVPKLPAQLDASEPITCRVRELEAGRERRAVAGPQASLALEVPDSVIAVEIAGITGKRPAH